MSEMRRVTAIRNGTVIDHIPTGRAMQVIKILGIDTTRATPISLVMNVPVINWAGKMYSKSRIGN